MKTVFIRLIRFYQRRISPVKGGSCCKFYPCCSQYAIEAIDRFGAFKGTLLALWRFLRCNPWSMGGVDLVPDKNVEKK